VFRGLWQSGAGDVELIDGGASDDVAWLVMSSADRSDSGIAKTWNVGTFASRNSSGTTARRGKCDAHTKAQHQHSKYALRAAAERTGVPLAEICARLAFRHGVDLEAPD
jgi:hypothetical protein